MNPDPSGTAREYAASRHLDPAKIEMGYNSGQFHHAGRFAKPGSPDSDSVSGAQRKQYLIESCLKVGLLLDKGLTSRTGEKAYAPFGKNGLVFALKNREGKITGLYFRSILNEKSAQHFYLKARQGLYPHYPNPSTSKLILTEAIIDAATLLQVGAVGGNPADGGTQGSALPTDFEILALYGTNGLTDEHLEAIKNMVKLKEVVFWFDGDESGNKAAEKYYAILKNENPPEKNGADPSKDHKSRNPKRRRYKQLAGRSFT